MYGIPQIAWALRNGLEYNAFAERALFYSVEIVAFGRL